MAAPPGGPSAHASERLTASAQDANASRVRYQPIDAPEEDPLARVIQTTTENVLHPCACGNSRLNAQTDRRR
jgi:hypothetical protein